MTIEFCIEMTDGEGFEKQAREARKELAGLREIVETMTGARDVIDELRVELAALKTALWETATRLHDAREHDAEVFDECDSPICKQAADALASK